MIEGLFFMSSGEFCGPFSQICHLQFSGQKKGAISGRMSVFVCLGHKKGIISGRVLSVSDFLLNGAL
jgi:hypothetical protein